MDINKYFEEIRAEVEGVIAVAKKTDITYIDDHVLMLRDVRAGRETGKKSAIQFSVIVVFDVLCVRVLRRWINRFSPSDQSVSLMRISILLFFVTFYQVMSKPLTQVASYCTATAAFIF